MIVKIDDRKKIGVSAMENSSKGKFFKTYRKTGMQCKYLVHRIEYAVNGNLNGRGIYADRKQLEEYAFGIEDAEKIEMVIESENEIKLVGMGLLPCDVRRILNKRFNANKEGVTTKSIEVKCYPQCSEHKLDSLVSEIKNRKEFVQRQPHEIEKYSFKGKIEKIFILYGDFGRYRMKLYKIAQSKADFFCFELVLDIEQSADAFDNTVDDMLGIFESFAYSNFKPIYEIEYSKVEGSQPYGIMVKSIKPRNILGADNAKAEAISRIDRDSSILYSDLLSLYSYASHSKADGADKMVSKFIKSNHLLRIVENGIDIVKRQEDTAVA
jgi:hypothetical protein